MDAPPPPSHAELQARLAPPLRPELALQDATVDAYRGITALALEELRRFNLVVGATNVGKTSLLEAVALVVQPTDLGLWHLAARADWSVAMASAVRDMFPSDATIRVSGHIARWGAQAVTARFRVTGEHFGMLDSLDARPSHEVRVEVDGARAANFGINVYSNALGTGASVRSEPPVSLTTHTIETMAGISAKALSAAVDANRKALVLDVLRLLDGDVVDLNVSVTEGGQRIVVQHATRGAADMRSFGDGFRAAFHLATRLATLERGLLLADELLASVHVGALRRLIPWLVEVATRLGVQLIATTHSLELVDAFVDALSDGDLDMFAVYRMGRFDGVSSVTRFAGEEVRLTREVVGEDLR